MLYRLVFVFGTITILNLTAYAFSQDEPPPSAIDPCNGLANTGATKCLLDAVGTDSCPDDASQPCNPGANFCEYNPNAGAYMCWDAAPQVWVTKGFIKRRGSETTAIKWSSPEPGSKGKEAQLTAWEKRVCKEIFICECNWYFEPSGYVCESKACGKLEILKLGKLNVECTQPGTPPPGGPGTGGPGGN